MFLALQVSGTGDDDDDDNDDNNSNIYLFCRTSILTRGFLRSGTSLNSV
jgi:hypothetical protein